MRYREDEVYLSEWQEQAKELAERIRTLAAKEQTYAIFTISTTRKLPEKLRPYLTPIRRITHGFIGGSVVFSQTQAMLLAKELDGHVDFILVDAEKKLPVMINMDQSIRQRFGLPPEEARRSRFEVELGNLSGACHDLVKKSFFVEYKPNDLTADAIWLFLSEYFDYLSGRKVAIIGAGNIGFKLGLKLVESGVETYLVRRDMAKGMVIANAINIVKPQATLARAHFTTDPIQASLFADAIIGCTEGTPVINWEMIECLGKHGIVLDVGKGTIENEALKRALEAEIPVFRADVSCALDGAIAAVLYNKRNFRERIGRQTIADCGITVVSGGVMGREDEIVVDNYRHPTHIVGVCQGNGDFKRELSAKNRQDLQKLKEYIERHENCGNRPGPHGLNTASGQSSQNDQRSTAAPDSPSPPAQE